MMKKILFRPRSIPLAFLLLCLIAYGLLIPWLGFYWDDWPYTWFSHTLGPLGLLKALAEDRPFLAGIYMTTTSIFGRSPLAWQLFDIFTRWLSVVAFWWTLRQVWPRHLRQVTWAALLFAVYPGFLQHWISVIYSQAFLLMAVFLYSIGLMVYAVRAGYGTRKYWIATAAALVLSAFAFFSTEYFFGVELIRPFLIWLVLRELTGQPRKRLVTTLLRYIPFAVEMLVYVVWRGFLFTASTYEVQAIKELSDSVSGTLANLAQTLIGNGWTAGWTSWSQALGAPNIWDFSIRTTQIYWAVLLVTLALALVYLLRLRYDPAGEEPASQAADVNWSIEAIVIGLLALLLSSLPFWAAGLPFNLVFPYNRFTLAMMFGACLALVGVLEFFFRTYRQKVVLVAVLVSFAVGLQFQTANTFRREWEMLRSFFWQVTWRMPALEPGTLLLTHEIPFKYYSDNSLSAPLNWIYAPDNHTQQMPYILDYLKIRMKNTLPDLKPGQAVKQHYRALTFTGNMSDSVVFFYNPPHCLRVLDATYTNGETFPDLQYWLVEAAPLTNFDRIVTDVDPVKPPADLFGKENQDTWCYYFEKAELARQEGDWQEVARLGNTARENKIGPQDPSEWLTFVEGYAHTSSWDMARSISATLYENNPELQPAACQTWKRLAKQANPGPGEQSMIQEILTEFKCSQTKP